MPWVSDGERHVVVEPLGAAAGGALLARVAYTSERFPGGRPGKPAPLYGAACGFEPGEIKIRAVAELIEHVAAYVSGYEPGRLLRASADELRRRGERALSPAAFRPEVAPPDAPALDPVDDDAAIHWARGVSLVRGEPVWVPALVAHLCWRPPPGEPTFARPTATGLAAHRERAAAIDHALREVLERDACMLSWRVPGWPVRRLDPALLARDLAGACAADGLEVELYDVADDGLPPVVIALLFRRGSGGEALSIGSACRAARVDAAAAAAREALMIRWTLARHADDPTAERPTRSIEHVVRAHRHGAEVRAWFRAQAAEHRGAPRAEERRAPSSLITAAHGALGGDLVAIDVADRQAREAGWHIVRVVVPHAYPREADARLAELGGFRLRAALARRAAGRPRHAAPHPFG